MRGRVLGAVLAFVFIGSPRVAAADALLPVEAYAAIPAAQMIRMSPDGGKFAYIGWVDGKQALIIHDLSGDRSPSVLNLGIYQARWVTWKTANRYVVGVFGSTDALFRGSSDQDEYTRMVAADADGTHATTIGEPRGGYHPNGSIDRTFMVHPQIQDIVVAFEPDDPSHLLQSVLDEIPRSRTRVAPAVYRVDIDTGAHERILSPYPNVDYFEVDPDGAVRLGTGIDGADQVTYVRDDSDSRWRQIHRTAANGTDPFRAVAFVAGQPDLLYVLARDPASGRRGLWTYQTQAGAFVTLIDTGIDTAAFPEVREGRLVSYRRRDGGRKYLDPDWQKDYDAIRKALKNVEGEIVDRTADGKRTLFRVTEPYQPAAWWLLDRAQTPANLITVAENYADIAAAGLAPIKRIAYQARDGLEITAYLTLPMVKPDGPIPFVVLPHGGPNSCDQPVFDYEVQFLASRGWGVLQPQFRGSTCFGREFEVRGFREWGFAMQDDVTDGTRWLIDQKLADPSRICIVGGSYGGYAALEGVVKEPDLYACAAAWAPVSDLPRLRDDIKRGLRPEVALDRLGDDTDRLRAASPARHADRIKVPVLLMHGKTDFTVQVEHSERMEEALKDAHKPVEAIYIDGADHYRLQYPARLAWLQALDRFLGTYLGRPPDVGAH